MQTQMLACRAIRAQASDPALLQRYTSLLSAVELAAVQQEQRPAAAAAALLFISRAASPAGFTLSPGAACAGKYACGWPPVPSPLVRAPASVQACVRAR